jgi:hypothetical protein
MACTRAGEWVSYLLLLSKHAAQQTQFVAQHHLIAAWMLSLLGPLA